MQLVLAGAALAAGEGEQGSGGGGGVDGDEDGAWHAESLLKLTGGVSGLALRGQARSYR